MNGFSRKVHCDEVQHAAADGSASAAERERRQQMTLRALLLTAFFLTIAACSYRVEFAVVNLADEPATVTVQLAHSQTCKFESSSFGVAPSSALQQGWFRRSRPEWVLLEPSAVLVSTDPCRFSTVIPGQTALRVAQAFNHPPPSKAQLEWLEVQHLSVSWSGKNTLQFEAAELAKRFQEARDNLWAIYFEPSA